MGLTGCSTGASSAERLQRLAEIKIYSEKLLYFLCRIKGYVC
jgi:hypothetical protein